MDSRIPHKLFYRIGDVAEITGIKAHILRYWESEFSDLHPRKNRAGQRLYERRDVDLILEIKRLLYEQRYTISGAKQLLAQQSKRAPKRLAPSVATSEVSTALRMCCQELRGLLVLLKHDGDGPRRLTGGVSGDK